MGTDRCGSGRALAPTLATVIPLDGPFYNDLSVGQTLPVQPALVVDAGIAALYQSIFGERLPMSLDPSATEAVTGTSQRLASPGLVAAISTGQSTTVSRRVIANLFYRDFRFLRPVEIGEALTTTVTVAAMADGSSKPGRQERGKVLVDVETRSGDDLVLTYQRCPMLPSHAAGPLGHNDDLGVAPPLDLAAYLPLVPSDWDLSALGTPTPWATGETIVDPMRDVIDNATGLVRMTHNLAMIHRDATMSPYPTRLVYGGHPLGLAQASLSRVVNGLATVLAWHECDHVGPAFEGDLLSFRHTLIDEAPSGTGHVLAVQVEGFAERDESVKILDWLVVVAAP